MKPQQGDPLGVGLSAILDRARATERYRSLRAQMVATLLSIYDQGNLAEVVKALREAGGKTDILRRFVAALPDRASEHGLWGTFDEVLQALLDDLPVIREEADVAWNRRMAHPSA